MMTEHMKQISKEKENIECQFQQNSFAPLSVLNRDPMEESPADITLKNNKRSDSFDDNDNSIVSLGNQQNRDTFLDQEK